MLFDSLDTPVPSQGNGVMFPFLFLPNRKISANQQANLTNRGSIVEAPKYKWETSISTLQIISIVHQEQPTQLSLDAMSSLPNLARHDDTAQLHAGTSNMFTKDTSAPIRFRTLPCSHPCPLLGGAFLLAVLIGDPAEINLLGLSPTPFDPPHTPSRASLNDDGCGRPSPIPPSPGIRFISVILPACTVLPFPRFESRDGLKGPNLGWFFWRKTPEWFLSKPY